jgi:hypothetical protein
MLFERRKPGGLLPMVTMDCVGKDEKEAFRSDMASKRCTSDFRAINPGLRTKMNPEWG